MKLPVIESPRARDDLAGHYAFIARDEFKAAERFLTAYEDALQTISEFPEIGARRSLKSVRLRDVRMWTLEKFTNYTIYYRIQSRSLLIVRVLHAAQDYTRY